MSDLIVKFTFPTPAGGRITLYSPDILFPDEIIQLISMMDINKYVAFQKRLQFSSEGWIRILRSKIFKKKFVNILGSIAYYIYECNLHTNERSCI